GLSLFHADEDDDDEGEEDDDMADMTVKDVFETLTEEQKNVVYFMIGEAIRGQKDEAAHADLEDALAHEDTTVQDVFDSFTEDQKNVVYFMIGEAIEGSSATHSDFDNPEGKEMSHNVFEGDNQHDGPTLSHS